MSATETITPEIAYALADAIRAEHGWLPRPPATSCEWCGAAPGEPCLVQTRRRAASRRRLFSTPGGCHPSRGGAS